MIANSLIFLVLSVFPLHSSFSNLLSSPPSLPSRPFFLRKFDFSALSSRLNPISSFFSLLYYLVPYLFLSYSPKVRAVIAKSLLDGHAFASNDQSRTARHPLFYTRFRPADRVGMSLGAKRWSGTKQFALFLIR